MLVLLRGAVGTPGPIGAGSTPAAGGFIAKVLVLFGRAMRAARSVGNRAAIEALFHR